MQKKVSDQAASMAKFCGAVAAVELLVLAMDLD